MKYYIVLDPITNTDPNSLFAAPRKFDKETILTAFHNQSMAKLFSKEEQALHFARSLFNKSRPPKTSGCISPIIECELELSPPYLTSENCVALDGDSEITKTNLVSMSVSYFEVPVKSIQDDALTKAFFPKETMRDIDLRNHALSCNIL